jgi:endonuclease/exonuclease/phosphatase (EEP) superfamily protein YafD
MSWRTIARTAAYALACCIVAGVLTALTISALARYSFVAEWFTHFHVFYAGAAFIGLLLFAALRSLKGVVVAGVVLAGPLLLIAPWYCGGEETASDGETVRIMSANVNWLNDDPTDFAALVREVEPDLVLVCELSPLWKRALEDVLAEYPHGVRKAENHAFGIGLYSRLPLMEAELVRLPGQRHDEIRAVFTLNEQEVVFYGVHALPPAKEEDAALRNASLAALADEAKSVAGPCIIAGDLNTTMWSPYYRDMIRASKLSNIRKGRGILPTWPAELDPFMIPIDHILYKGGLVPGNVQRRRVKAADHLVLIADFALK